MAIISTKDVYPYISYDAMNRKKLILLTALLVSIVLLVLWRWNLQLPNRSVAWPVMADQGVNSQSRSLLLDASARLAEGGDVGKQQAWTTAWNAPIDFWGKVIDEKGNPVEGATALYVVGNSFDNNANELRGETLSDARGLFSILGKKGAFLNVVASKEGYYQLGEDKEDKPASGGIYRYWQRGKTGVQLPTSDSPVIFTLKKKGEAAALIKRESLRFKIPKNGAALEVNLETGLLAAAGQGDLKIECWSSDNAKDDQAPFDWKCRISIPGGGLIKRKAPLDFEAPETGYRQFEEINMPRTAVEWTDIIDREYFVKLSNKNYANLNIKVYMYDTPFISLRYFYNPTGSRNLEYDSAKEIEVK